MHRPLTSIQDEWIVTCFLNNAYCCYLPAHCSHCFQLLDNGIFNLSQLCSDICESRRGAYEKGDDIIRPETYWTLAYLTESRVVISIAQECRGYSYTGSLKVSPRSLQTLNINGFKGRPFASRTASLDWIPNGTGTIVITGHHLNCQSISFLHHGSQPHRGHRADVFPSSGSKSTLHQKTRQSLTSHRAVNHEFYWL
ncbi:Uncharacterized protein HZ326_21296 [Fusarium oxysporum f. sp. albedinis]|nr:Uncharacterized protein HZ326_21296 [Fusarium oxysporum f. sp. albedinis]